MRNDLKERIHERAKEANWGDVKIIHEAQILRAGWEMDNEGCVVECENGELVGLTTNHGGLCKWELNELRAQLVQTEASATALRKALELLGATQ